MEKLIQQLKAALSLSNNNNFYLYTSICTHIMSVALGSQSFTQAPPICLWLRQRPPDGMEVH